MVSKQSLLLSKPRRACEHLLLRNNSVKDPTLLGRHVFFCRALVVHLLAEAKGSKCAAWPSPRETLLSRAYLKLLSHRGRQAEGPLCCRVVDTRQLSDSLQWAALSVCTCEL
jgi:hypothetical protein